MSPFEKGFEWKILNKFKTRMFKWLKLFLLLVSKQALPALNSTIFIFSGSPLLFTVQYKRNMLIGPHFASFIPCYITCIAWFVP